MPKIGSQNSMESPKRRHNRPAVLWDAVSSIGDFIGTTTAEDCVRLVSPDSPTQITVERGYQSSLINGTPGPWAFRIRVKRLSPMNGFAAFSNGAKRRATRETTPRCNLRWGSPIAGALAYASFVTSPEAEDFHHSEVVEDLVDQPVLDVDPARIGSRQVANQFLKRRRSLIWILCQSGKQEFRFRLKTGSRQLFRILLRLPRKDDPPTHQRSSGVQASTGVVRPLRIDSRIPGIESKWSVS